MRRTRRDAAGSASARRRAGILAMIVALVAAGVAVPSAAEGRQPPPTPSTSPSVEPSPSVLPSASAEPSASSAPTTPTSGATASSATTSVLPYQASGYRYEVVASGGGPADFMTTGFDDSSWPGGTAAFGSGGSCSLQSTVATAWAPNTDLLLRHHIALPAGSSGLTVYLAIDNDASVYWNGTLLGSVTHENCPSLDSASFPVPDGLLVGGDNVLAVRAVDRGDESFADLRVDGTLGPSGPPAAQTYGTGSGRHGPATTRFVAEPVNSATGNYVNEVTDLALPGRRLGFAFVRTYNSLDPATGPLGPGWTHAYAVSLTINPDGSALLRAEGGGQYGFAPDGAGGFVAPAGSTDHLSSVAGGYELRRRDQLR